jgi:His-Xaa-Ser system radical SAM maturase HxsB
MPSGKILVTNACYEHLFLSKSEFFDWISGRAIPDELTARLTEKGFVSSVPQEAFASVQGALLARARDYLFTPTNLFIFVLTLECEQACVYCQARKARDQWSKTHMSVATARKAVERVFESPATAITIEFQGGEPLLNFDALATVVEQATRIAQSSGRNVNFQITTNLQDMSVDKAAFLVEHKVSICTSCDGPSSLHDANRPLKGGGSSFASIVKWVPVLNRMYRDSGQNNRVFALATVTRESLRFPEEIVDTYLSLGLDSVFLRPVSPFGKGACRSDYSPEEFAEFYKKAFNVILDRVAKGHLIRERFAAMFAQKVFNKKAVNFMELRSPCGAAIGQLAFDWNGDVYTCDEARMLGQAGDKTFCIGNVWQNGYRQWLEQEIVRQAVVASCLECHPDCSDCAFSPFCGLCPVYNYTQQGSLFGDMAYNNFCAIRRHMFSYLFSLIEDAESDAARVLRVWAA